MAPIRIALLGSGIFAREKHLPALIAPGSGFQIVGIYSRSKENAQSLAATVPYPVDTFTEFPALLARDDVDAVDIILPIAVQPAAVETALKAGKHVISDKPVAP